MVLKILDLILMIGVENLVIGGKLGRNLEKLYYYFEFLNNFEVPRSNQKKTENWILNYSDWRKNKDTNVRFLTHKIETHAKYNHKIADKLQSDWVRSFHISNIVKLDLPSDLRAELLEFELDEEFLLRWATHQAHFGDRVLRVLDRGGEPVHLACGGPAEDPAGRGQRDGAAVLLEW